MKSNPRCKGRAGGRDPSPFVDQSVPGPAPDVPGRQNLPQPPPGGRDQLRPGHLHHSSLVGL